ncbi:MAG: hypothetical protein EOO65_02465 [Methanosarcinales archaeon]|nr:MAG: hypothetical protein EOO65_02465 [Methanosarcinales archaeon]
MRASTVAATLLACAVSLLLGRDAFAHSGANWYAGYNPLPSDGAVIVHGNARFTILTDGVVRMEYQAERRFNDAPTLFALHRATVVPTFNHSVAGSVLTITTTNMRIEYDADTERGSHGGAEFSPGNMHMSLLVPPYSRWAPFDAPTGNLHGTFRTLDRVFSPVDLTCQPITHFNVYYSHCEEGLVSRDGWVLVDETVKPRLYADPVYGMFPGSPEPLALLRPARYIDWYLFGHGRNYKAAMKDFVTLSGPIPLVPRYALGPAFSRWYQWNDMENVGIVQNGFAKHGIPLDVLVIDMDWYVMARVRCVAIHELVFVCVCVCVGR